ncbi:MAG: plasmid pRiA4b ORF-3 family protein [Bacteroidota bacterium]|nr:plasmid pRiA4b ORF-3 family protein [Bacteroidota bacterium]
MAEKIYQIKISLKGIQPLIWRRLYIHSGILLSDFHKMIQTVMGWTNSYPHQFIKNKKYYVVPSDNFGDDVSNIDYRDYKVLNLLKKEGDTIIYEYDLGDGWVHEILLEKMSEVNPHSAYPICDNGEMNCPPEGCGGVDGYKDLLEIITNSGHEEYVETIRWLGPGFDPTYFCYSDKNEMLRRKDFGCMGC